jgi:hypothetical protein
VTSARPLTQSGAGVRIRRIERQQQGSGLPVRSLTEAFG